MVENSNKFNISETKLPSSISSLGYYNIYEISSNITLLISRNSIPVIEEEVSASYVLSSITKPYEDNFSIDTGYPPTLVGCTQALYNITNPFVYRLAGNDLTKYCTCIINRNSLIDFNSKLRFLYCLEYSNGKWFLTCNLYKTGEKKAGDELFRIIQNTLAEAYQILLLLANDEKAIRIIHLITNNTSHPSYKVTNINPSQYYFKIFENT